MTLRATPAGVSAPDRSTHAGRVEGSSPDKSHSPSPPGWRLSRRPTTSSRKKQCYGNLSKKLYFSVSCGGGAGTASMTSDSESLGETVTARR